MTCDWVGRRGRWSGWERRRECRIYLSTVSYDTYIPYIYVHTVLMYVYIQYLCVHTVLMYVYGCAPTYVRMHVIVALRANWCVGVTRAVVIILKPYRTM